MFGLKFRRGMVFSPLGLRTGCTSSLRVGGPALLPLTANTIVSSVVGVTFGAPILLLCNSALPVRNVRASIGHAPWGITTSTLRVTNVLAVFTLYGSLGSLDRKALKPY